MFDRFNEVTEEWDIRKTVAIEITEEDRDAIVEALEAFGYDRDNESRYEKFLAGTVAEKLYAEVVRLYGEYEWERV